MKKQVLVAAIIAAFAPALATADVVTKSPEKSNSIVSSLTAQDSGHVYSNLVHQQLPGTVSAPTLQQAIAQASKAWHDTGTASAIAGQNGEVIYPYGQSAPVVLCSPLHTTVIKLLPGEKIAGSALGDKIRWTATNVQLGNQGVVMVRPMQSGITTNLVVAATDGKIYDLTLVSDKAKFVPSVGFYDPQQEWDKSVIAVEQQNEMKKAAEDKATMTVGGSLKNLDFDYYCTGSHRFRPIRVFSSRGKVYIQMPENIKYGNAPAVFVMENGKEQLTNYQMIDGYFVVDQLFQEAKLLLGTGDDKEVVTIHAGKPSEW
ncbi:TrbG/VirB9 family P-type conjugative transfer protein [Acidithiobacillus caldus]|uniref:TrbG/VirB9 family P-type conjugative transfer protein n=1 Tax=Acidithiobacillus caldus TaxID=33059 RepID=UPI001C067943|nr:TrbG/VirB9 family P-type conjugative transfer protein [Acidithiobacillus caldus]MBU2770130.1 TrbG/VirB9 family P-type conjugative transfer protein [Acidithiobacillus caldus]